MKLRTLLPLSLCLVSAALLVAACESEKSGTGDDILDVTPSYKRLSQGNSVVLTAHGGSDYLWTLSDESIGGLSSRHGSSVTYTAYVCGDADTVQTVTVESRLSGGISTTNSANVATGTATILHVAKEEQQEVSDLAPVLTLSSQSVKPGHSVKCKIVGGSKPFIWTLDNYDKGTLTGTTGNSEIFTANSSITAETSVTITVNTSGSSISQTINIVP